MKQAALQEPGSSSEASSETGMPCIPPDHVVVNHRQPCCDQILLFRRCGETGDGRLVQVAAVLHELQHLSPGPQLTAASAAH